MFLVIERTSFFYLEAKFAGHKNFLNVYKEGSLLPLWSKCGCEYIYKYNIKIFIFIFSAFGLELFV